MLKQNKVFYNFVIDGDLFFTIYDYLRFHPSAARNDYKIRTTDDFDNLTLEDWEDLAEDAILWLEHYQLPEVTLLSDIAPSMDTWGTLYYQTLNYIGIKEVGQPTLHNRDLNGIVKACINCIEYLKEKRFEIREVTDEDLKNI
jgi:hypothetical protein